MNIPVHRGLLAAMHKAPEEELKESVLGFIQKYGFLGFMTALPTTADFITYESVYLPKKHFIKAETLSTEEYLSYFYPFDKPDFRKNGMESGWSVTDREGIAIAMAMGNAPQAVTMESQKEYSEKYDWLVKEFTDLAFTFMTSFLYYLDYDTIDEQTRNLYRQGISAFGGISPTYRIALEKQAALYCKRLGINYNKLSDVEFQQLVHILGKSKFFKSHISQRKKTEIRKPLLHGCVVSHAATVLCWWYSVENVV